MPVSIRVLLCVALTWIGTAAEPHLGLNLTDCTLGKEKIAARCGTFAVYENRLSRAGRTISLPIVVLPARYRTDKAIFWNPGGPGASAVDNAALIVDGAFEKELMELRDRYDIVFVDVRGVGGPDRLQCDLWPAAHPELYFRQLWPDSLLRVCRDELATRANLNLYTSSITADDLDDLREALRYPRIVLDGGSYGTYLYLVYMRQHPQRVESAILDGVAPPGLLRIPLQDAAGAQLAMDALFASCRHDAPCARAFPRLAAHVAEVVRRFDEGAVQMPLRNRVTRRVQVVALSKEVFTDRLRQVLFLPETAAYVPYILERAYRGDYAPLATMIYVMTQEYAQALAAGTNLSVTCAEDIPFITEEDVRRTSAGSFEGDVRVRAQQHACSIWNVTAVPPSSNEPVRSDTPVLMISGSDDPTSPAKFSELELPYLRNAKRVLVSGAAHVTETRCTDRLKVAFVNAGSASHLDVTTCAAAFRRPPFAMSMVGFESQP